MRSLGIVRVFTQDDLAELHRVTCKLYGLPSYDEQIRREREQPTRLKERVRRVLFRLLALGTTRTAVPIDGRRVHKVLLFRYDRFGDFVITSALIEWLRAALPGVIIDAVASDGNRALLEADPRLRRVISIDSAHGFRPSWLRVRKLGKEERYDVVIAAVFMKMTKAALLARFASSRALMVTVRHADRSAMYGEIFDAQVPRIPGEHWALTMARIGPFCITPVADVPEGTAQPRLSISKQVSDGSRQRYAVVNISSNGANRQWRASACIPVIRALRASAAHVDILVSGAPSDAADVAAIVAEVNDAGVRQWKGSVTEMLAMIAGAQLLLSPDTATVHVAAATGVPCVVLFAELIKAAEWYPFGVPFRAIVSADPEGVNDIPWETVLQSALDLLQPPNPQ